MCGESSTQGINMWGSPHKESICERALHKRSQYVKTPPHSFFSLLFPPLIHPAPAGGRGGRWREGRLKSEFQQARKNQKKRKNQKNQKNQQKKCGNPVFSQGLPVSERKNQRFDCKNTMFSLSSIDFSRKKQ